MDQVKRLIVKGQAGLVEVNGRMQAMGKLERWIDVGDFVLVDPRNYYEPPESGPGSYVGIHNGVPFVWGMVTSIAPGSASVYPVKVQFDMLEEGGFQPGGQFKTSEVLAVDHEGSSDRDAEPEYWHDNFPESNVA